MPDWLVTIFFIWVAVTVGIPLGIGVHMLVARIFGWTYDEESGRWD